MTVKNCFYAACCWLLVLLPLVAVVSGCGEKGRARVKVTGTVKYQDGAIPAGEVCVIRFEPVSMATAQADPNTKAASGAIQPDGSFQLTTIDPNDGAFPGDYKVTFTIMEKYDAASPSLVAPAYMSASTTPLERSVKPGEKNHFDLEIERAK